MDKDVEEMQHLRAWDILKESAKLLVSHSRLLLSLAAALVLPLSFVLLGHTLVTEPLAARIGHNELLLEAESNEAARRTERQIYMELAWLAVLLLVYLAFLLAFSLLSTAAVVYSAACIYLDKSVSVVNVLGVVPRVWRRLLVTLLWVFLIILGYQVAIAVTIVLLLVALPTALLTPLFALVGIGFLALHVYLGLVWHLASVVTVLEDHRGLAAIKKSAALVKGKRLTGICLVLLYMLATGLIAGAFRSAVVFSATSGSSRFLLALLLVLALTLVNLLGMLAQSVFYFAVKSYHHESIDRLGLSDHLDAYLAGYMPLKEPPSSIALGAVGRHNDGGDEDELV